MEQSPRETISWFLEQTLTHGTELKWHTGSSLTLMRSKLQMEISKSKGTGKSSDIWMFAHFYIAPQSKWKSSKEILKTHRTEWKWKKYQNLWDAAKVILREKFRILNARIRNKASLPKVPASKDDKINPKWAEGRKESGAGFNEIKDNGGGINEKE